MFSQLFLMDFLSYAFVLQQFSFYREIILTQHKHDTKAAGQQGIQSCVEVA